MKYLGKISDKKDLVTKEYTEDLVSQSINSLPKTVAADFIFESSGYVEGESGEYYYEFEPPEFPYDFGDEFDVICDGEIYKDVPYVESPDGGGIGAGGEDEFDFSEYPFSITIPIDSEGDEGYANFEDEGYHTFIIFKNVKKHLRKVSEIAVGWKDNENDITYKIPREYLDIPKSAAVRYDVFQNLTPEEMQLARDNIEASNFSGSYNDLSDKPTIPTALSQLPGDATHRTVTDTEKQTWNGKQDAIPSNTYDAYGAATAVQTNLNAVTAKISDSASATNKLVSASEMGDAIEAVEAKQLYATNAQGSFATKAALTSAAVFYNADGTVATPTKNDVAYVLADESHSNKSAKYVIANEPSSTVAPVWGFVITFSDTTFSQAQMNAINSGVTSLDVSRIPSTAKQDEWDSKSTVSVSDTGTATDEVQYITINGVEKKLAGGLPVVTAADAGKVLTVVNGVWVAAELPVYDGTVI